MCLVLCFGRRRVLRVEGCRSEALGRTKGGIRSVVGAFSLVAPECVADKCDPSFLVSYQDGQELLQNRRKPKFCTGRLSIGWGEGGVGGGAQVSGLKCVWS